MNLAEPTHLTGRDYGPELRLLKHDEAAEDAESRALEGPRAGENRSLYLPRALCGSVASRQVHLS